MVLRLPVGVEVFWVVPQGGVPSHLPPVHEELRACRGERGNADEGAAGHVNEGETRSDCRTAALL